LALTLGLTCGLLPGCAQKPAAPVAPPPARAAGYVDIVLPDLSVAQPLLPEPSSLGRSEHAPVGSYLLPERVVEVKPADMPRDNPDITRFDVEASLEEVIEFYSRRGYKVVRNPKGASVFPRSGDGILQILRGEGRKLRLVVISETTRASDPPIPPANEQLD
jgi:hypothetical protein